MNSNSTIQDDTGKRHRHKYENTNFIHRLTLGRFLDAIGREIKFLNLEHTLDFGCGEGLFLQELKQRGIIFKNLFGIDLRSDAVLDAQTLLPEYQFETVDLLSWDKPERSFDLVIASQVLEHLPNPDIFLKKLVLLSNRFLLFTVPWEPWFRLTNLARGRDLPRFGNHPEHINHWRKDSFKRFIEPHATITKLYTIFPFIIAIVKRYGVE
jgi:SAM-dependent methyltransferase